MVHAQGVATKCWCCRKPGAVYLWTTWIHNTVPLCERCCAEWRLNARQDPALSPKTITDLRPAPTD